MSLKSAFEEIGALYATAAGGSRPAFNFGASGDLLAQIRGGAPADVFAAAAAKDMDVLEAEGRLLPGTRVDFAANEIVLIVPAASTAGVSSFADLAKPAVARIAIVNPKTGPAGRYAEEVFASAGIADAVRPKLVLAENVRQVLDYVARGEVDAGVVYATDAAIAPAGGEGRRRRAGRQPQARRLPDCRHQGVNARGSRQGFPGRGPLRGRAGDPGPVRLQGGPGRPVTR